MPTTGTGYYLFGKIDNSNPWSLGTCSTKTETVVPKKRHLKQEHSPNCCGCDFMSWFPQGVPTKEQLKEVEEQLAEQEPIYNSMMLVILNNLQKPYYHDMLIKKGYRIVMDDVYHNGHGHDLTLYGWQKYKESPNGKNKNNR